MNDEMRQKLPSAAALLAAFLVVVVLGELLPPQLPYAHAVPAPEVEYLYDVSVRRQYGFPNNDPVGYGHTICDKVIRGESYAQVMGEVRNDITPKDEYAANYLVSNAINLLCPAQIWQLRNSAGGYQAPPS
jgi:hypothetical protein